MLFKKAGGHIFGVEFTPKEKKAIDMEIRKDLAKYIRNNDLEIDALILWALHEHFGFGKKRLKKFYDNFYPSLDELASRYEMADIDKPWLCIKQLKDYGIDIEQWNNEK